MTVTFVPAGSWTCVLCDDPEAVRRLLDGPLSYKVNGYFWSPAYKARRWDGKCHLLRKDRTGSLYIPAGVEDLAFARLTAHGVGVSREGDPLAVEPTAIHPEWRGPSLRDYQQAAFEKAIVVGRGLLKLPIRSGKTLLAARIIAHMRKRALFVVSSRLLLDQAAKAFQEALHGVTVTKAGGGVWDTSGDIVVATVQTLSEYRGSREFAALARSTPIVFLDECHHTKDGEAWRDTILQLEGRHKFGLSATFRLADKGENETSSIWLRALCGPLVYEASFSDLIERGFLARPTVMFHRHNAPEMPDPHWSQSVIADGITSCSERNALIVRLACEAALAGRRVLIDVARIKHVKLLAGEISCRLLPKQVFPIIGDTTDDVRENILSGLESGSIKVVVGTILGEGVDLPHLNDVINGEGGKAEVSTIQRLRNLTACEGKEGALIHEMIDNHHPYLHKWTMARFKIYSEERAFRIEAEDEDGRWVSRS